MHKTCKILYLFFRTSDSLLVHEFWKKIFSYPSLNWVRERTSMMHRKFRASGTRLTVTMALYTARRNRTYGVQYTEYSV